MRIPPCNVCIVFYNLPSSNINTFLVHLSFVGKKRGRNNVFLMEPNAKRLKGAEIGNEKDLEDAMKEVSLADGGIPSLPFESMDSEAVLNGYEGTFLYIKKWVWAQNTRQCSRN